MTARRRSRTPVLVVGFGVRGRQWHAAAGARRDIEASAVVDPAPVARDAAARAGLRAWPTLEEALARAAPRAAVIASPPALHAEQALACLRAGVAVLVEKPLATSLGDARRVAAEAARAGLPALVGQNFRFRRPELAVRRVLAGGAIGAVRAGIVTSARPAAVMRQSARALPHAPLWDLAIHHLDLLRLRMGGVAEAVTARVTGGGPLIYTIELRWDGGRHVLYRLAEGAPAFSHLEWLEGERGALRIVDGRVFVVSPQRRARRIRTLRAAAPRQVLLDRLLEGLASRGSPEPSAADNLETIATVEAAIASLAGGRTVRPASVHGAEALEAAGG